MPAQKRKGIVLDARSLMKASSASLTGVRALGSVRRLWRDRCRASDNFCSGVVELSYREAKLLPIYCPVFWPDYSAANEVDEVHRFYGSCSDSGFGSSRAFTLADQLEIVGAEIGGGNVVNYVLGGVLDSGSISVSALDEGFNLVGGLDYRVARRSQDCYD